MLSTVEIWMHKKENWHITKKEGGCWGALRLEKEIIVVLILIGFFLSSLAAIRSEINTFFFLKINWCVFYSYSVERVNSLYY